MSSPAPQPLMFGAQEGPIFGWYHPPAVEAGRGGAARSCGVVLCNPLGYEAICTHRAYRALAERLATAGFPVLRFDYHGTGDSSGDDEDPDRVRAWQGSIGAALDEVKARAGVEELSLFGVRMGATLAVAAVTERSGVGSMVLWAPCLRGKAYLREMKAFRMMAEKELGSMSSAPPPLREGDEEAGGFLFSAETMASLTTLDLLAMRKPSAPRVLLIARDDVPSEQPLRTHLQDCGVDTTYKELPGYAAMMVDPHRSRIPDTVFDAVVNWLGEAHPQRATVVQPSPPAIAVASVSVAVRIPSGATSVREQPTLFARDRLFGILTEPQAAPPGARRPAALFLNAGAIHRVGPNRMYTTMARAWAARGFTCFRFDVTGLGDSAGEGPAGRRMYSEDAVSDVQEAMRFLSATRGIERFVLVGLCSGAYVAFHTGLRSPAVVGEILINPQTFYWKEGDSLEIRRNNYNETRHYQKSVFRKESWAKALRGDVDFKYVFEVLSGRAKIVAKEKLRELREMVRGEEVAEGEVAGAFRTMADRSIDTLLVFSRDDPGLDYLEMHLGKDARRLPQRGNFRLEVIDGADHTFTPLWSQRHLRRMLSEHLAHFS